MQLRLDKNDSADLGFASECVTGNIITFDEFKEWLNWIVEHTEGYPTFIFDMMDVQDRFDYIADEPEIVGFTPHWNPTKDEAKAVDGIGYKRFPNFNSDAAPKDVALAALERNPQIEARFRTLFPFIDY